MNVATFIPWRNPLAKLMQTPGGVRIGDALEQANVNLETVRQTCLEVMDSQLEQIERLCAEGDTRLTDEVKLLIYDLSNDIHAVAGVFGLTELSEATFSFCELVDRLRSRERWNPAAVAIFLSAFRLLRHPDAEVDRSSVIQGLQRLTEQIDTLNP